MVDQVRNFAKGNVSTGYGAGDVTIILATGVAARFPNPPFNAIWWQSTDYDDPADDPNVEIVRVTSIDGDTLTITRGQENTVASSKNTGSKTYKLAQTWTARYYQDVTPVEGSSGSVLVGGAAPAFSPTPVLGTPGSILGALTMAGNIGGTFMFRPAGSAGNWVMQVPTGPGTEGFSLVTDGTGVCDWKASPSYTSSTLPTPSTAIQGLRATLTNSSLPAAGNFGAAVSGGGNYVTPIFCTGTSWIYA